MAAVVKARRDGNGKVYFSAADFRKILDCLRSRFVVEIVEDADDDEELIDILSPEWMDRTRHLALKGYRLRAGMTQREVAARTGIRQTAISEYERGTRPLTSAAATELAKALGVDAARLLW